ncbi:MAG: isochorismatase family protein [Elusimicrobiota bacterium]
MMEILQRKDWPGLASLYLARLRKDDSLAIEFVDTLEPGVSKSRKWVMMVSTQFGCPVGCRICDAGSLGYGGNLTAQEIMEQIRRIVQENPELDIRSHPKVKIHFARMGEPSLNTDVLGALALLAQEFPYSGIIPSLSSVAPKTPKAVSFFEELTALKDRYFSNGRFQLQFSLHATDETARSEIVPIKKWSLEEISSFGRRFSGTGDRKVTLNFALSSGQGVEARQIARIFDPKKFLIKVTPVNPTTTADHNQTSCLWNEPPKFALDLERDIKGYGFDVILSPSLPEEIAAATSCGQLWSEALKAESAIALENQRREDGSYVTTENLREKTQAWMLALESYRRRDFSLRPGRAGLLVVDMQDFFLSPKSRAYLPAGRAILANVYKLTTCFREQGRPVYFTTHAYESLRLEGGPMADWWSQACLDGTPDSRVSAMLAPETGRVFRKCRYSAFSNPALHRALRADGVEDLAVAGIKTNLCVESTARNAFDLDLRTFVIADATAAKTEEFHLSSLKALAHGFSSVARTKEVVEAIGRLAGAEVLSKRPDALAWPAS